MRRRGAASLVAQGQLIMDLDEMKAVKVARADHQDRGAKLKSNLGQTWTPVDRLLCEVRVQPSEHP
jgi:hypothetical protein